MQTPAEDQASEAALRAVKRGFYAGELPAAVSAGQAVLAAIDPNAPGAGQQSTRAQALLWLVRCARRADELDTALAHAYSGVAAARSAGNARLECQLQAQYVHVLASLGQNETALEQGYKVLRLAVECVDTLAQAACWLALGHVHWAMQQWHEGEVAYTHALTLATLCGDQEICGLASNGIAAMADHDATEARAAGRTHEAEAHARRSFALLEDFVRNSQEIGDTYNAWIGAYNQACCLFGMGEHAAAFERLNTQLRQLGSECGSRRQLLIQMLGDIHLAQGRQELAIACQTEAMDIAERLQLPLLAMDACRSLVAALEQSGDFRAALAQHRRFHALYVQLASSKAQAHARAMAVIYETEKTQALAEAQRQRADRLATVNNDLVQEKEVLQRSSMEDALTGLANRRRFDEALEHALGARGNPPERALAMIDVDHFKRINDRFSHLLGDEVLRRLGALLLGHCRKQDLAARYGGEEFVLILTDVDPATARATCERLRAAVEAEPWSVVHPDLHVTVSIGVVHAAEAQAPGEHHNLLAIADTRLYAAKRSGRNRVVAGAESATQGA
jgi:diguanylate cyclase (GGDEF)-like protein